MTALLCNLYNCLNSSSSNRKHYIGLRFDKWNSQVFSGCIGLYRSKITNNDPKMFSKGETEIPHERGRTMSLTEVLIEMGLLSPTEVTDV